MALKFTPKNIIWHYMGPEAYFLVLDKTLGRSRREDFEFEVDFYWQCVLISVFTELPNKFWTTFLTKFLDFRGHLFRKESIPFCLIFIIFAFSVCLLNIMTSRGRGETSNKTARCTAHALCSFFFSASGRHASRIWCRVLFFISFLTLRNGAFGAKGAAS